MPKKEQKKKDLGTNRVMLDKADKRLRAIAYTLTALFLTVMLFPLAYVVSLSLQGENAIYNYPPHIIPPAVKSISISISYDGQKNLSEEALKSIMLKDTILAMHGPIYELNKHTVGEIKVYGTIDGKVVYYSRAHGNLLKLQTQYGVYQRVGIVPNVLLQEKRYPAAMEEIGYQFDLNGVGKALRADTKEDDRSLCGNIAGFLGNTFATTGKVSQVAAQDSYLLMLENYKYYFQVPQLLYKDYPAVKQFSFFAFMGNTVLAVVWIMFCQTILTAVTAYPLSKLLKPRTANLLILFFLATLMIPFVVTMAPQILLIQDLGMYNTRAGMLLPFMVPAPMWIYLYKGFFDRIPSSYFEAARIDGANEFYTFFKICIPMSKPIVFITALNSFIWGWSEFMWFYLVGNQPNLWTINVAVYIFSNMENQVRQNFLMGMSLISIIPVLILAAAFSKKIKENIVGVGLKG